ncbi:uncharacterized protein AB9W97_017553 isoform 3-T12 [Spinachia spinachia]
MSTKQEEKGLQPTPRGSDRKCRSGEVWEITTLILSKTDSLIKTGGILTGSRLLRWECSGELDCQASAPPPLVTTQVSPTISGNEVRWSQQSPVLIVHIVGRPPYRDFLLHQGPTNNSTTL